MSAGAPFGSGPSMNRGGGDGIAAALVFVLVVFVALIALGAYGASRGWWG